MVIGKKFSWSHSYSNVWVNSKSNSAPQSFSDFTSKNEIEYADCIVIGAGMAGIVAARDLSFPTGSRQGMKVIVLESSHRIGGRILTLDDERMGGPVELGADYIHRGPSKEISIWNDIETSSKPTSSL